MRKKVVALCLAVTVANASATDAFTDFGIVLLQPDAVLQERAPSVEEFAAYLKSVQLSVESVAFETHTVGPAGGFVVVAIKPGNKSHVWLDFNPPLPSRVAARIVSAAEAVRPVTVKSGVVLFSLKVGLWGGKEPSAVAPNPAEWKAVSKKLGRMVEAGELAEAAWAEQKR